MLSKSEVEKMLQEGKAYIVETCPLTGISVDNIQECDSFDVCECDPTVFDQMVYEKDTGKFLGDMEDFKD